MTTPLMKRLVGSALHSSAPVHPMMRPGIEQALKQLLFLPFQRPLVDRAGLVLALDFRQLAADRLLVVITALGLVQERLKHPLPTGDRPGDGECEKLEQT